MKINTKDAVKAIQNQKKELERAITKLCQQFTKNTGLHIKNLLFKEFSVYYPQSEKCFYEIKTEINL